MREGRYAVLRLVSELRLLYSRCLAWGVCPDSIMLPSVTVTWESPESGQLRCVGRSGRPPLSW